MRAALATGSIVLLIAGAVSSAQASVRDNRTAALRVLQTDARIGEADAKAALADERAGKTSAANTAIGVLARTVGALKDAVAVVTPPPDLAAVEPGSRRL